MFHCVLPGILRRGAALASCILLSLASTLGAQSALASGFYLNTAETNSRLFLADPTLGTQTLIGNTGINTLTDLALSANGTLIGSSLGSLYTINRTTGASSLIGNFGTTSAMLGLDFSSNGTLYGIDVNGRVFTINPGTGAATQVMTTGLQISGDIVYGAGSTLYTVANNPVQVNNASPTTSQLIRIDLGNLTTTNLGDVSSGLKITGLSFDTGGQLIAFARTGEALTITNYQSSGAGVLMHTFIDPANNGGLAIAGSVAAVPEPETHALLLAGLVLVGAVARRKGRTRPA